MIDFGVRLPPAWLAEFEGATISSVATGMSGAWVWRIAGSLGERYLKITEGEGAAGLHREIERTSWLSASQIRVPAILRTHDEPGIAAVLTAAVPGIPADEAELPPAELVKLLGRGLAKLHALPAASCPFDETLHIRLARARMLVAEGAIDPNEFADRNHGVVPSELLLRLSRQIPREDLVVAHGDATLSNMIIDGDGSIGFVDCGHCGRADRYVDLAVVAQEIENHLGAARVNGFASAYGLRALDLDKSHYFADLYELF